MTRLWVRPFGFPVVKSYSFLQTLPEHIAKLYLVLAGPHYVGFGAHQEGESAWPSRLWNVLE